MNIENYFKIKETIPPHVRLVAVSKTKPVENIQLLYQEGQRIFGENKAQELKAKYEELPKDIEWHFIGHLQTNKIKYIAPFVNLIHSIDSYALLKEVNRYAEKNNRILSCLLQFHIALEESKFGFSLEECEKMLAQQEFEQYKNIQLCGVMGMATFTHDKEQVRNEFKNLASYFHQIKAKYFTSDVHFKEISMGMTEDYQMAIEEGSTLIRIGSAIFGSRS
ncbi:MAG: YggS family pyridoxal phosphate-dependent enzyme [Bacteroidales bacterium]